MKDILPRVVASRNWMRGHTIAGVLVSVLFSVLCPLSCHAAWVLVSQSVTDGTLDTGGAGFDLNKAWGATGNAYVYTTYHATWDWEPAGTAPTVAYLVVTAGESFGGDFWPGDPMTGSMSDGLGDSVTETYYGPPGGPGSVTEGCTTPSGGDVITESGGGGQIVSISFNDTMMLSVAASGPDVYGYGLSLSAVPQNSP